MENECTINRRDEDSKKRNEWETNKNSKGEQEQRGKTNYQVQDKSITEATKISPPKRNQKGDLSNNDCHNQTSDQQVN